MPSTCCVLCTAGPNVFVNQSFQPVYFQQCINVCVASSKQWHLMLSSKLTNIRRWRHAANSHIHHKTTTPIIMYPPTDEDAKSALASTAFRVCEKQFQVQHPQSNSRRHRRRKTQQIPPPLPLHLLIDPRATPAQSQLYHVPQPDNTAVLSHTHPGLVLFPAALTTQQQLNLAHQCLETFPNRPCTTNHSAHHGLLDNLWRAACADETIQGIPALRLLHKLRWACVGPNYDWTAREYRHEEPHLPLPSALVDLATHFASAAYAALAAEGQHCRGDCNGVGSRDQHHDGAPPVRPFVPDAALVNYYRQGDTLGGHQDDVEQDLDQPIVSMSLGCSAVFLIGGHTRDEVPTPLLLRGGDVVVMTGPARRCFHGVPRVLDGSWEQGPEELPSSPYDLSFQQPQLEREFREHYHQTSQTKDCIWGVFLLVLLREFQEGHLLRGPYYMEWYLRYAGEILTHWDSIPSQCTLDTMRVQDADHVFPAPYAGTAHGIAVQATIWQTQASHPHMPPMLPFAGVAGIAVLPPNQCNMRRGAAGGHGGACYTTVSFYQLFLPVEGALDLQYRKHIAGAVDLVQTGHVL